MERKRFFITGTLLGGTVLTAWCAYIQLTHHSPDVIESTPTGQATPKLPPDPNLKISIETPTPTHFADHFAHHKTPTSLPETTSPTTPLPARIKPPKPVGEPTAITVENGSTGLVNYLKEISSEFEALKPSIRQHNIYEDYSSLGESQRIADFETYFPFYKAGEIKYGVPWLLLWLIHVHETNVSRCANPEINGYLGGMQRNPQFYPDSTAQQAANGWEFLAEQPQRYTRAKGFRTNDYEEILFAAWKINRDAASIKAKQTHLSSEESILQAQYSYCAATYAKKRIDQYLKVKGLLAP